VAQIGAVIGRDFSYPLVRSVAAIEDAPLQAALERLAEADILLVQGVPPDSNYRFKHALIRDAAYENLLKSRRQILHRHVAEVLRNQFAQSGAAEPELLARHFTQAGLTEAAIEWWGRAGQQSLERSALVEATEQFTRALAQIAALASTPTLRGQQIKFQVGLTNALMHTKGRAAPETKATVDQARSLINKVEALGEPLEDPLVLFSVLYGLWNESFIAFSGDTLGAVSLEILTLAEKQGATTPLMVGHRLMGMWLLHTGDIAGARTHFVRAIALYDPAAHVSLATRFGQDVRVAILSFGSQALWVLGYPEAALADADQALSYARETRQAATLMYALGVTTLTHIVCGNFAVASAMLDELIALVDEKGAIHWKGIGMSVRGWLRSLTGDASGSVQIIIAGISAYRSTGATQALPVLLSFLASAYAELGQFDNARRRIDEAIVVVESTRDRLFEADIHRIAGEITLRSPKPDAARAEADFNRALAIARKQQAKSWELRAAMSMARLWRDQGKRNEARELLAPVYGWFTEGFETLDLKEAKALLDELHT
jgi:predicted ATPase